MSSFGVKSHDDVTNATINTHSAYIKNLQGTTADHEIRIDSAENTLSDHSNHLAVDEQTLTDHENRVSAAEGTIIDHENRVDIIEGTLTNHENRISIAEATIVEHTQSISTLSDQQHSHEAVMDDINVRVRQLEMQMQFVQAELANNTSSIEDLRTTKLSYKIFAYTGAEQTFDIPLDTNTVFITMVAGGGAGSCGFINSGIFYAGNAGGSAAGVINYPFDVSRDRQLKIYAGKGGDPFINENSLSDGQDSYVKGATTNNIVTVSKGFGASFSGPGGGGIAYINGYPGNTGGLGLPSLPMPIGGKGADSCLGLGGAAGYPGHLDGSDGINGSAGGGSSIGGIPGKGGNGLVVLYYPGSS